MGTRQGTHFGGYGLLDDFSSPDALLLGHDERRKNTKDCSHGAIDKKAGFQTATNDGRTLDLELNPDHETPATDVLHHGPVTNPLA
jgi:hypothetical protein